MGGSKFFIRTLTGLIAAPIVVACTYWGGFAFLVLILVLALAGVNEFYNLMRRKDYHPAVYLGNLVVIFFILAAYYALKKNWEPGHSFILTLACMLTLSAAVFIKRAEEAIVDIAVTLLGMIYIGWFFSYFLFLRALTDHGAYIFFLMFSVWSNDIIAYFFGKFFGRHPLSKSISPKKTIEGALAGIIFCIISAMAWGYYFMNMNLWHAAILGLIIGVLAVISDLVESLIKRDAGVKDSSNLIPGHGGVLDRLDSFILAAPVVYYYAVWVILK